MWLEGVKGHPLPTEGQTPLFEQPSSVLPDPCLVLEGVRWAAGEGCRTGVPVLSIMGHG